MEDNTKLAFSIAEEAVVPHTHKLVGTAQYGIIVHLLPGSVDALAGGHSNGIVLACISVARVRHIVRSVVLDDEGAFVHHGIQLFPFLLGTRHLLERIEFHCGEIGFQFAPKISIYMSMQE